MLQMKKSFKKENDLQRNALVQSRNQAEEAIQTGPILQEPEPNISQRRVRAPPRCSDCHMIGHKRLQCPNRVNNYFFLQKCMF